MRDLIPRGETVIAYGRNPDIDSAAAEDIIDQGGSFVYPTSAETLEIVSASANDDGDPVGTGARTVKVTGLDADYNLVSETVTMNGATAVELTGNDYLRVFSVEVVTAGSVGTNDGALTLRVSPAGATRVQVLANRGRSHVASYTIPAGKTGYLVTVDAAILPDIPSNAECEIELLVREFNAAPAWQVRYSMSIQQFPSRIPFRDFILPMRIPEKSDLRLRGSSSVDNTPMSGTLHLLVV